MTNLQQRYLQAIQSDYPDLPIQNAALNSGEGQYNDLLLVNGEIIFRFPKLEAGLVTLKREVSLLRQLQGQLPLPIPAPTYVSADMETLGYAFMGYPRIPGEPLWHPRFRTIQDPQTLRRMAAQLASFLRDLHAIPVEKLTLDLPVQDQPEEWADLYEEIRQHVLPLIAAAARDSISNHFEVFLDQVNQHPFGPTLRHGDFGSGNILYDPQSRSISGIIDFGFAGLGDPAVDIAAAMTFGDTFFAHYHAAYPGLSELLDRAHFYKGTFALQEALYGVKHDDPRALARGIAPYT